MSEAKRIQLRRTKGWRKPEGAIVVARPTRWGNPVAWSAHQVRDAFTGEIVVATKDAPAAARRIAVDGFRSMLANPEYRAINNYPGDDEIRSALRGHDLACWCPLDQPCHADVLLELANS